MTRKLTNHNKIKRLQWQIDEIRESQCKQVDEAIARREKAIKHLTKHSKEIGWETIEEMFGFRYHSRMYYTPKVK